MRAAAEVQRQIDAAWEKLEPVIEQYNKVRAELAANRKRSAELGRRIEPLAKTVEASTAQIQQIAARYYKLGNSLSTPRRAFAWCRWPVQTCAVTSTPRYRARTGGGSRMSW